MIFQTLFWIWLQNFHNQVCNLVKIEILNGIPDLNDHLVGNLHFRIFYFTITIGFQKVENSNPENLIFFPFGFRGSVRFTGRIWANYHWHTLSTWKWYIRTFYWSNGTICTIWKFDSIQFNFKEFAVIFNFKKLCPQSAMEFIFCF